MDFTFHEWRRQVSVWAVWNYQHQL